MKINLRKVKGFLHKHKISTAIVLIAVVFFCAILIYDKGNNPIFKNGSIVPANKSKNTKVSAPLTGLPVDANVASRRPFAVVIENSPEARPQSGYTKADVVYETLAEGGITRTLAIFQSQDSNEIGPVRSARIYFIEWLSEVNAIFSHVGGSAEALSDIKNKNIPDLNQFYYGNYFWRSATRYAPHNVYTTTSKLKAAAKQAGYSLSQSTKWYNFKDDAKTEEKGTSQNVSIGFSGPLFEVGYKYDPVKNEYIRSVAGVALKDRASGEAVKARNIIIQFENMANVVKSGVQAVDMGTIGSGKAILIQDGKAKTGKWSKSSRNSLTNITLDDGTEMKLNRGQTWIEVVPQYATISY